MKAEFPHLASHNLTGYVRVNFRDTHREAAIAKYNAGNFEATLQRQIGLRYLFDGMIHSDGLENFNILSCFTRKTAPKTHGDQQRVVEQFKEVKEKLRRPTVLVGHNVFTDLVNFYACFIGPLPATVEGFQKDIHSFFPLIIDTKYLAAQLGKTSGLRSSLTGLDLELKDMPLPRVECHAHHLRYSCHEQFFGHEAGFDSCITARVLIRLSAKLEALNRPETQPEKSGGDLIDFGEDTDAEIVNPYSRELAEVFGIDLSLSTTQSKPDGVLNPVGNNRPINMQISDFIPGFETPFWQSYGNRLMVNGTIEHVCHL